MIDDEKHTVEEMQEWDKRFKLDILDPTKVIDTADGGEFWTVHGNEAYNLCILLNELSEENKQLKAQLHYDDEEGVCNICMHHYLVKDDEIELGYYNSRCKKGHHYECARVSLKYCEDFEKELEE